MDRLALAAASLVPGAPLAEHLFPTHFAGDVLTRLHRGAIMHLPHPLRAFSPHDSNRQRRHRDDASASLRPVQLEIVTQSQSSLFDFTDVMR